MGMCRPTCILLILTKRKDVDSAEISQLFCPKNVDGATHNIYIQKCNSDLAEHLSDIN